MRKIAAATAAIALSVPLALSAAPAQAAAKPKPTRAEIQRQIQKLPEPLRSAAENPLTLGWDAKGPYIVWFGGMGCHIHLFIPEEWSWAWGTGPCWF
jgi:hypothetical protein